MVLYVETHIDTMWGVLEVVYSLYEVDTNNNVSI